MPADVILVDVEDVAGRPNLLASLTAPERAHYEGFFRLAEEIAKKRSREWLAGRVAAKWAIQLKTGLPFEVIEITNVESGPERGRPVARAQGHDLGWWVSITHSGSLAAAVARRVPVGLDLEVLGPRDSGFEVLVLSPEERARLEEGDRDLQLTAAFVFKEAIVKCRATGLSTPFYEVRPDDHDVETGLIRHHGRTYPWALASARGARESRREVLP